MNKSKPIIILVFLLLLPGFAHAGMYLQVRPNVKHGEFAAPSGIFNSALNLAPNKEFNTRGLFPGGSILENTHSGELKSSSGIFNQGSSEFRGPAILKTSKGEFSSIGLISGAGESAVTKDAFKSADQGVFKFALPK